MENHIEILKEEISVWEYKFPSFPGAPRPPIRNRRSHGESLKSGLLGAIGAINEARNAAGIESDKLLVLELSSDVMEPDVDLLQNKLGLSIVEEIQNKDGTAKLVVQFSSQDAIASFEHERILYEIDSPDVGILTYRQRSDFFACINDIRRLSKEDRTGQKLSNAIAEDTLPDGLFLVDIDVWYNGDPVNKSFIESQIRQALGTGGSNLCGDLFALPNLLLGRVNVNRFTLESIRNLDLIALVDLPLGVVSTEQCELYSSEFVPQINDTLDDNAPIACVIDSGVFSGNPLLSSLIVAEEDFDLAENSASDFNGHGTGVAGIVAYGNFHEFDKTNRVFKPLVRICNGKVMHNLQDPFGNDETEFPLNKRPEQLVKEAIRYFHREYDCRIYNLSLGDSNRIYAGGRQMAWASLLDELARELDIVVVVSAGNVSDLDVPDFNNRIDLMEKSRNQLLSTGHRLIDPATTALGITVGSITRYEEPESFPQRPTPLSAGKKDYPSVFTRTGAGVNGAVKPEFVDYGGNLAVVRPIGGRPHWRSNRTLNEPTLNNTLEKVFKGWQGTSFSAPHVTHVAARLERALQLQLGEVPSSNLIRALLASSAKCYEKDWLEATTPPEFISGAQRQPQSWRLRLCGYGKVDDSTLFTDRNHVTLFAEDALDLRQIHLYKIPVPTEFLNLRTNKRIAIGFAYNPPTRLSRKAYIANSLWFEVFRRIDAEALLNYKGKKADADEDAAEDIIENFSRKYGAPFFPGYTEVRDSTLQQRVWEKSAYGGSDLLWDDNDPYIYVLITGKPKFKHPNEMEPQPYALAVTFSYDNAEDIQLRQKISERANIRLREQVRTRAQIQV